MPLLRYWLLMWLRLVQWLPQYRTALLATVFIMVSVVLLWFVRDADCISTAFTWYGLMPAQVRCSLRGESR